MSYTDAIIVFTYAPHCADIGHAILARKELEAAAARLLKQGGK
jgi:hypothetical protein